MIEALKKLDKKFLILTGVIIAIPILIIVILAAVQGCSKKGTTYEKYENEMISSAEKYFKDNDMIPTEEGKKVTVKLSTLIKKDYIKSSEIKLKDDTCSGSVSVRRNGSSEKLDEEGILNYTVDLNCDNYSTKHLIDLIKENIVTEGDG